MGSFNILSNTTDGVKDMLHVAGSRATDGYMYLLKRSSRNARVPIAWQISLPQHTHLLEDIAGDCGG